MEHDNHFTVFVRLPFNRGDFVDPPPVAWSAGKERELWDLISRQTKGNEVDWTLLANQFQVTQQFLLQQAAWLYERQLSQVRAQMRRMGTRQSVTASPVPGSTAGSVISAQPAKRPPGLSSRGPSRLSTQASTTVAGADTSAPSTPQRSRTSLTFKSVVHGGTGSQARGIPAASKPHSRRPSKDNEPLSRTQSRRGSVQHQLARSPGEIRPAELSSSDEDETESKPNHRRPNPAASQRRASTLRKSPHSKQSSHPVPQLDEQQEDGDGDDDDDDPAFLPFATTTIHPDESPVSLVDPSATLRGGFGHLAAKPVLRRNHTSERVKPGTSMAAALAEQKEHPYPLGSSNSSLSSNNAPPVMGFTRPTQPPVPPPSQPSHGAAAAARASPANLPTPLSPRQQAALAAAAGLSPRRRSVNPHHTGSESSPSMGSSFSDLDDASVTQSALEEALMSNMGSTAATMGGMGGVGGALGSRVSGISQALRSRYFDTRSGAGQGDAQR